MTFTRFIDGRNPDGTSTTLTASDGRFVDDGPADEVIDLGGRLVLPGLAEPHAHLDKAMLAERHPNPDGDLMGAIETMQSAWSLIDRTDVEQRARRAIRQMVASGTTFIRTHADTHSFAGLLPVETLTALRDEFAALATIQVVSLCYPVTGPDGAFGRQLLDQALSLGVDVVGGAPHLEDDPESAMDFLLDTASAAGLPVDLHVDEVLDAGIDSLRRLADGVEARGLGGRVNASHCVSHGLKPLDDQREIAATLASAGVSVVTLPRTNLYLQARGVDSAPPRGTAGVQTLLDAGVVVAGGADNVQDPFYSVGRCDPLETASLLVSVCHRSPDEAFAMVTGSVRSIGGLEVNSLTPGSPADFVAIRADSVRQAIADQPADRIVVNRGRVVATTTVEQWVAC